MRKKTRMEQKMLKMVVDKEVVNVLLLILVVETIKIRKGMKMVKKVKMNLMKRKMILPKKLLKKLNLVMKNA
jgi:hypothetical protein